MRHNRLFLCCSLIFLTGTALGEPTLPQWVGWLDKGVYAVRQSASAQLGRRLEVDGMTLRSPVNVRRWTAQQPW